LYIKVALVSFQMRVEQKKKQWNADTKGSRGGHCLTTIKIIQH